MSRMPEVGDEVDDVFRVEEELDHGNFGAIYRVHDILEDRTLALKIQKPGPHDAEEVRQRFEREARLIYSLEHRNVVQVLYFGETGEDLPYMALEFLEGTDLKQLLRGGYALQPAQIKRIALETLSALRAAHEVGIVHRDLKPANIFLVDDGQQGYVKVLDFGFAKSLDDEEGRDLTQADTLVGSPAYMAPELVRKENVGAHSDLYAMGLIIAEMITGEKTVKIESIYDTIMFQGSEEPIELAPAVENSPFASVIHRAVQKDIDRRYGSAEEMIADLKPIEVGDDTANLQEHAEVENEQTAPFVMGEADPDAETTPQSHGMPPLEDLDDEMEGAGDTRVTPPGNKPHITPPSDEHESAGNHRTNTDDLNRSTAGMAAVDPADPHNTGPQQGIDEQSERRSSSTGPQTAVDAGRPTQTDPDKQTGPRAAVGRRDDPNGSKRTDDRGHHQTLPPQEAKDLDLEAERPSSSEPRHPQRSLLTEILLGILLGTIALAIILTILIFTR